MVRKVEGATTVGANDVDYFLFSKNKLPHLREFLYGTSAICSIAGPVCHMILIAIYGDAS